MKRFVFIGLMTSLGLTVPGLAPARPSPTAGEPERVASGVRTPTATWTCAHNAYRSVACP